MVSNSLPSFLIFFDDDLRPKEEPHYLYKILMTSTDVL